MFQNIFPKSLTGLLHQIHPKHRFQAVMYPLISLEEYLNYSAARSVNSLPLTKGELIQVQQFKIQKRRNEWLTGRICAKHATSQLWNSCQRSSDSFLQASDILIANDTTGRPYLTGELNDDIKNLDISISHSDGYGLALTAENYCGIDIQSPQDKLISVMEKFCTATEEELLTEKIPELNQLQYLTLLWTAKEAAKKCLSHKRMPGFLDLILTNTEAHTTGWELNFLVGASNFHNYPKAITVIAELYEAYGIAICLSKDNYHA